MRSLLILTGILLLTAEAFSQRGTVGGRILDAHTGERLPGAAIALEGTLRGTIADTAGEFQLAEVQPGARLLLVSCIGYARQQVEVVVADGGSARVEVRLVPIAVTVDPVIITASRREQTLQESPVSISVLDESAIAWRNAQTVDDALRYIPGVNMTGWQVNIRGSSGYSRGAGSRVLLLVDGIPLMTGDTGELNFESLPIGEVDRIEVVKGASSALYGSNALGGVINVRMRRIAEQPETRMRAYGGLYGGPAYSAWEWGGGMRSQGGLSVLHEQRIGDAGISVFGARSVDNGYRQNDGWQRWNAGARAEIPFSATDRLTLSFSILSQERGSFLYWKDLSHALVPPDAAQGERVTSDRWYGGGSYTRVINQDLSMTVSGLWYHNRFRDDIGGQNDDSRSDAAGAEVQATWKPAARHIVTMGGGVTHDRVRSTLFGGRAGSGGAVYAQDEYALLDELRLTAGARFDASSVDSLTSISQLNPKASLTYAPGAGTTLRASVGRGFRAPSVAEAFTTTRVAGLLVVPNPHLRPERSTSVEVGVNQVLGSAAVLDLACFQTEYTDLIETGFNTRGQGQFDNVTDARVRGMEASVSLALLDRAITATAGYTYVDPVDRGTGAVLKYRPRHTLTATAEYHVGSVRFSVDQRWLSRVERIDEEFVTLGIVKDGDQRVAITVTDVRCGYTFASAPLTAVLSVNNLFNYQYVELIGNLAPPRSVVLTLEYRAPW